MKQTKTKLMFLFANFILSAVIAQSPAHRYLAQLPPLPDNICTIPAVEGEKLRNRILSVIELIEAEAERIEKQQPTQTQMTKSIAHQTGISEDQLNELTNSEDESKGEKVADQKMQTEYGISMEEAKKMEQMSEKELQQWGENYAKNQSNTAPKGEKQNKDKQLVLITSEIEKTNAELTAYITRWSNMEMELKRQDQLANKELNECLEKVKNSTPKPKYQGEACTNQNEIDEYVSKNENRCHQTYCNRVSPLKIHNHNQKMADLQKMITLTIKLQTLQNDMLKIQTGIDLNATEANMIGALSLVRDYAKEMYNLL